jgi:hypothetical protein
MRGLPVGSRCARALVLAMALFGVTGCASSDGQFSAMMFADPGKYLYKTCDEIAAAAIYAEARQKKLAELIAKAEQGTGGAVVGTIAYRGEYRTVSEERVVIEDTARSKNCLTSGNWRSREVIR